MFCWEKVLGCLGQSKSMNFMESLLSIVLQRSVFVSFCTQRHVVHCMSQSELTRYLS